MLRANTVPYPKLPPSFAVPYRVSPDITNPAYGITPSLLEGGKPEVAVNLCRVSKPVLSVLILNTVPLFQIPPPNVVPYRVLPNPGVLDKINPPNG